MLHSMSGDGPLICLIRPFLEHIFERIYDMFFMHCSRELSAKGDTGKVGINSDSDLLTRNIECDQFLSSVLRLTKTLYFIT